MRDLDPKNSDKRNSALQQSREQQCGKKKTLLLSQTLIEKCTKNNVMKTAVPYVLLKDTVTNTDCTFRSTSLLKALKIPAFNTKYRKLS